MIKRSACSVPYMPSANLHDSLQSSGDRRWVGGLTALRGRSGRARNIAALAAAAVLACASSLSAQTPTLAAAWNQLSPANSPVQRFASGMAYDTAHGQTVLFGGFEPGGAGSDTWLWNGTNWTQANPANSPSGRTAVAMAYDAGQGQVVMFGGADSGGNRLSETWLWNGSNWTQANPATVPPARNGAAMAYDSAHDRVVLFGGVSTGGSQLNDTWLWDGSNWTQANPVTVPQGRELEGMDYDPVNGQIVMFGGFDALGAYDNQTWTWDGTNWTLQNPSISPIGRYGAVMAYDAAQGVTLLFGGYNGTAYMNDTWIWNGATSTWTQIDTLPTFPSVRDSEESMVYDSARSQIVLFGGYNGSDDFADTWTFGLPQNFGNVNVCPAGHSTPAPCSNTLSLTYIFSTTTTLGTPQVVTQGATGLDFTQANGGNCSGQIVAGNSCTLNVTFTPQLPGSRTGAVRLVDNSGNLLTTTLLYGTGEGPEIVYGPAFSGITILGGPSLENVLSTTGFTPNPRGMTTDASGNLYIADPSNERLLMRAANGTTTTVGTLSFPQDAAIDGAGNLFVADTGLREVVEIPAGCVTSTCQVPVYAPASANPVAVVVDGLGNLFIADSSAGGVVEVPAGCASSSCRVPIGSGWHSVNALALDAAGDLFVTDSFAGSVTKMPAGCTSNSCRVGVGSWIVPDGVAVDAAGDVFVSDIAADGGMGQVAEVPAGCASSSCQMPLVTGIAAFDLAVDALGQVYVGDANNHQILQVNQSQPPTESFATTNVGFTSTDSPQSFTLLNAGNQTLSAVLPGFGATGPNFYQVSGSGTPPDCIYNFSLAPGAGCNASLSFMPQQSGNLTGTATATDNNLNAASATQTFNLSGSALGASQTFTLTGAGLGDGFVVSSPTGINCNVLSGVASGTCTANFPAGTSISLQEVPTSGSTFAGWGNACANAGTNQFCNLTINSTTTVVASFDPGGTTFPLQVTAAGTGSGEIVSSPAGISCDLNSGVSSGTCSASFSSGTAVTLTTIATGNSVFAGWGGDCSSAGAGMNCIDAISSASNVTATLVAPSAAQPSALMPITAGVVYGQGGSFSTGAANNGGISASSFSSAQGEVIDSNGNLYVADGNNNRVLFFPRGSTTATRVYGQNGSFTTGTANNGGVSANSLNNPQGLALDGSGNLYVADQSNGRVLFYPAGSTTATRVYGQNGSFTSGVQNNGGVTANSLGQPYGLAVDGSGNLYVADYLNSRVLFYPAGSTTATQVYGQGGNFTTNTPNNGGISATSLNQPTGVALDSSGNLYVADIYNNRVLFFPYNSTMATQVYGQGGSFTSSAANNGGVSAGLNNPMYVTLDSTGDLYVVDRSNNRALFYPFGSTTATRVYGQNGSFSSAAANNGGINANSLSQPWGVAVDASGNLYVSDYSNNRVLEYGSFGNVNVCPSGQSTPAPCSTTVTESYYAASDTNFGATQVVTQGATGLDFSLASGNTCTGTVTAGNTCQVNVTFTPLAAGSRSGAVNLFDSNGISLATAPAYGTGQAPVAAFGPGTQVVLSATGLNRPTGVALDAAGDLFIADYANNQIVKVAPGGVQTTVPTNGLSNPRGVAVDGAGNLFISDAGNARVVEIPAGCTTAACQVTVPTTGLNNFDGGLAVDGAGNIFIADTGNARVVKVTPSGVQTTVPASGLAGPFGVGVDAAGDVFIADTYGNQVVEVTAGGVQTTVPTVGVTAPEGVWADAAGDVFVADSIPNNRIVEIPAGGGAQITVYTGQAPEDVVTDGTGDIVIADTFNGRVVAINRSTPPSLSFPLTNALGTSSPLTFNVQNVGNQTLTGSVALSLGTNFVSNATSTCGSGFVLTPGAACLESFSFTPQSTGPFTGVADFSDNTLNLSPLVALQTVTLSGTAGLNGQPVGATVPDVVGMTQPAATSAITGAQLTLGTVSTQASSSEPAGSVIGSNPAAGTQVNLGTPVQILISTGAAPTPTPNPLSLLNNYFVTGDYASAGVTLRGTGIGGIATGTITIPDSTTSPGAGQGVPDGADIVDGYLYWETLENTASPSGNTGTFLGYSITGQQVGSDAPYTDGTFTGTLRVYRADVNTYFPVAANGIRSGSGSFKVSLPDGGGTGFPLTEGASLVVIYRVLSPNFPLKSVVIYDGAAMPASATTQNIQGFYDAVGGAGGTGEVTALFASGGSWNNSLSTPTLGQPDHYNAQLNAGSAYAAVVLSTPVNNSDNDGILDAWKTGPAAGDFFAGQPGYYDVKTSSWVSLPGAKHGEKDLFVQLDYMCGSVLLNGACDPSQENLFPSPDSTGKDPLAMVQAAFAQSGVVLHLQIGNAVPEDTCTDSNGQLCQFPNQPGVIGWKNSIDFSKLWPRNFTSCAEGGDCTPRFPYGQKDSYHYVLFGHSLAIPAWNTRYGTLASITVANGVTTLVTTDRGTGINACPSRITISGVLGNPNLNGVYNTASCPDTKTITVSTPNVTNWSYPNATLPEPAIGLTSGTVTSISGYSDLGGADSAVTLGLWETAPNQDMSKRANVIAGTLFHEIGHTLGLSHGGLYYDTPGSYVPTFDVNCKPNYQSVMNYLFQLDGVGPNGSVAYSNQTLATLSETSLASTTQLTDGVGNPASFSTSSWYVPYVAGTSTASPATLHCDGTPLSGDQAYRVNGSVAPVTPAWTNGQNIAFDGVPYTQLRGYNDVAALDLRQVGATGGEFASLASTISFGSSNAPLSVAAGGNVALGSGGTIALGSGGNVTLGSGSNVTLGSGGTIALGSGNSVTLNNGATATLSTGGNVTLGSGGTIALGSGSNVTLGGSGVITLGSGGTITLGSGGPIALGSGGVIALGSGKSVTIPSTGGTYTLPDGGGTITLGSGGTIALGSGSNITFGGSGVIAMGSGGVIALGSGGPISLSNGGVIALGSGGTIALGSGSNITLSGGGIVTLGSGGLITMGSGGNVVLGSGGLVTLGSGSNLSVGSGGNVTLGSGGNVTLGSGGTVTLGSGGPVSLSAGGTIALGSGGTITLGSGGPVKLDSGGTITLGSGGTITLGSGASYTIPSSGGTITLGSGGLVTLGSGNTVTLSGGGIITMGSGGTVTLGSGGNVTLGSGGVVALGSGGNIALGSGGNIALGSGGNITLGSGGVTTNELTFDTANSVVRPPALPTETPMSAPSGSQVRVDWTAPSFGVVATYTISRSSNGGTPVVIGSVSGVNGFPPATTFTDTNPDLTSQTVVYTISTTLTPDTGTSTQRESPPSPPAVLKNDQTIVLGALPSSVSISSGPLAVTATAESNGVANGLQVSFSATGSCSVGSPSMTDGVSSASVALNDTGSCTITASQAGATSYNAANSVSGTVMIVPQGSSTQSQTITFPQLPNVQYGGTFTLSASSSAALSVTFTASGPCTTGGATTGVGLCTITASAPASNNYSAASVSQSFTVFPAVIKVTATNFTIAYGHALPTLTYTYSGFVNNDPNSVVTGTPALSTTATSTSNVGSYPITVSTGSIAAANYSFLYVNGALTIQAANQTALTLSAGPTLTYKQSEPLSITGGSTGGTVSYMLNSGPCSIASGQITANSGTGSCTVTATMAGNGNYNSVTSNTALITLQPASQAITFTTNPPASAAYNSSFTVAATGGASGNAVTFSSSGACSNTGATFKMTSGTGTCSVIASQAGNTNYAAATTTKTVNATPIAQTIAFTTNPPASAAYNSSFTVAAKGGASGNAVLFTSSGSCTNSGATYTITGSTGTCSVIANQAGNTNYAAAPTVTKTVNVTGPVISLSTSTINFGTVYLASITTKTITVTNTGTTPATISTPFLSLVQGGVASEFVAVNLCLAPLAPGKSCTVTIAFVAGPYYKPQTAMLNITDNTPGSPQTVALNATVINPLAIPSSTSLNFGTIKHGTSSTLNVTLINPGGTALAINGISIAGANATAFTQTNTCGSSLASGASCTIAVKFTPPTTGTFSASLTFADNAQTGGTQTVSLSGKGN